MIGSDVAFTHTALGDPIVRQVGEPLSVCRMYTTNAPMVNPNLRDDQICSEDIGPAGNIDKLITIEKTDHGDKMVFSEENYQKVMKGILHHFFLSCQRDGVKVPILPGFGLGVYIPPEWQTQAYRGFVGAMEELLLQNAKQYGFDAVVFADPNEKLQQDIQQMIDNNRFSFFKVINGSCLDVAHQLGLKGVKTGLLSAGDTNGIPGKYWELGHIALEELFALCSTLIHAQHPSANPNIIGEPSEYQVFQPSPPNQ